MVITNGANAGVAGLVGSSKVMLGQVRVRLGQVRKYLLDDSVTLIITIKKSVHKNSPKMSTRIHSKHVHKNSPKKQSYRDQVLQTLTLYSGTHI